MITKGLNMKSKKQKLNLKGICIFYQGKYSSTDDEVLNMTSVNDAKSMVII